VNKGVFVYGTAAEGGGWGCSFGVAAAGRGFCYCSRS
nr:hypothetical protein [Tanacetum cinerariifolium]